jgi:hypothetical protein
MMGQSDSPIAVFAAVVIAAAVATATVLAGQADPLAARLQTGLPIVPVQAVSAGQVLLSLNVSDRGAVGAIDVLRSTPPFTTAVVAAVRAGVLPAQDALRKADAIARVGRRDVWRADLNVPTVGRAALRM